MIDPRKTKAEAAHQATPKKRMKCSICTSFVYPDACKSLKGPVSENGWCKLYSSKRQTASK
ncbi:hypothetical protein [Roseibium sp.]|uniref:hypothetical protein n=1 Tax=Roseibium sp. TaxID=1936156 RepID=UPI003B52A994